MKKLIVPISLSIAALFSSCSEEITEKEQFQAQQQLDNDSGILIADFNNALEIASAVNFEEELDAIQYNVFISDETDAIITPLYYDKCAKLNIDTTAQNYHYTLNFGKDDCVCADGKKRRGTIEIIVPIQEVIAGYSYNVIAWDYAINDFVGTGEKTMVYEGMNNNNEKVFQSEGSFTYTTPYGRTVNQKSNKIKTLRNGRGYKYFTTAGFATGTTNDMKDYKIQIEEDITFGGTCDNITSGTFSLIGPYSEDYVLDYGNDVCDNSINIIVDQKINEVKLY